MSRAACLLLAALCLASIACAADGICEIKRVTVEPTANGLRIRVVTDGLLQLACTPDAVRWARQARLSFRLPNVRAGADPMVQIGAYPVSHIEFSIPAGSVDRAGLDCVLVLASPGRMTAFDGAPYAWDDSGWTTDSLVQVLLTVTAQQNELLIQVISDKPGLAPLNPLLSPVETRIAVDGDAGDVTVEALNADLHHVLARLSDVTGVAITPGDTATRRISVRLAHQPLPRVLALLARSAGLGVTERDGAYYFTPGLTDAPAGFWAATARTIPLTYLAPADAVALLPDALLAAVRPNADARSVVVHGPKPLLDKIARDLEALDAPPRMCTVRAWVVTADADDAIARDWMARIAGGDTRAALTAGGAIDVALGPRAAREVLAELTLADTTGRLSVKSVPSATVITGRQARLFVGQTTYYWADDVLMSTQVGAMLRVTPRISDACIAADIRIESNTLAGRNALGPRVLRRSVETTVRLQPGAPLVVGGLRFATTDHTRGRPAEWGTTLSDMLGTRAGESAGRSAWVIISAEEVRATPSSLRETLP